jgi:hypothetical protein
LIPASEEQAGRVWDEHVDTRIKSRTNAVADFVLKWGKTIPPKTIVEFSNRRKVIVDDKNNPILDENNEPVYLYCMNTHHNHPVFWGGGNDVRTYIDRTFHDFFHEDFDQTIRYVERCLNRYSRKAGEHIFDQDYLRRFFFRNPHVADVLGQIPHVKIDDGVISVAILWSHERFCVPSLLQFEYQYGGIIGPGDSGGLDAALRQPTVGHKQPETGCFPS